MPNKTTTLRNLLENLDAKVSHIEDMTADNRAIIVKLVKQGNQIVKFLKELEIEEVITDGDIDIESTFPSSVEEEGYINRVKSLKSLIDDYVDTHEDLKEFEEELRKHKDKITPGTIGES